MYCQHFCKISIQHDLISMVKYLVNVSSYVMCQNPQNIFWWNRLRFQYTSHDLTHKVNIVAMFSKMYIISSQLTKNRLLPLSWNDSRGLWCTCTILKCGVSEHPRLPYNGCSVSRSYTCHSPFIIVLGFRIYNIIYLSKYIALIKLPNQLIWRPHKSHNPFRSLTSMKLL